MYRKTLITLSCASCLQLFAQTNISQEIFTLSASNINNRLQHLKANFTEAGWQYYLNALKQSGTFNALTEQNLQLSATVIQTKPTILKLHYDFPDYSYDQTLTVKLNLIANRIDSFSSEIIQQSALTEKFPACKLHKNIV